MGSLDGKPGTVSKWAVFKDRLAITLVIIALLVLFFFLIDGAVVNLRCKFWDFITFQCNRWDARWKPWD